MNCCHHPKISANTLNFWLKQSRLAFLTATVWTEVWSPEIFCLLTAYHNEEVLESHLAICQLVHKSKDLSTNVSLHEKKYLKKKEQKTTYIFFLQNSFGIHVMCSVMKEFFYGRAEKRCF
jgi:hypothetical protein